MTKQKTYEEWVWDMVYGDAPPPVCSPEPDEDPVDYDALAIEICGHWPGPLDAQQQHDLLTEARERGLV